MKKKQNKLPPNARQRNLYEMKKKKKEPQISPSFYYI